MHKISQPIQVQIWLVTSQNKPCAALLADVCFVSVGPGYDWLWVGYHKHCMGWIQTGGFCLPFRNHIVYQSKPSGLPYHLCLGSWIPPHECECVFLHIIPIYRQGVVKLHLFHFKIRDYALNTKDLLKFIMKKICRLFLILFSFLTFSVSFC